MKRSRAIKEGIELIFVILILASAIDTMIGSNNKTNTIKRLTELNKDREEQLRQCGCYPAGKKE